MSDAVQLPGGQSRPAGYPRSDRRFPATIGRFDDAHARETMDGLVAWVEDRFRDELRQRPSKHAYVRHLPAEVQRRVDLLRDHPVVQSAILQHFDAGCVITPMKHTDELYISHYNKDHGGDQGLYSKHYDGNLRFLPFGTVVRSLIYLQSDATYKVVFADSKVEKAFASYDFGILDFHRELHWVDGEYNPEDRQRILLKCNYLVAPRNAGLPARAVLAANTAVFYVVKAAMEYSKSPKTPLQRFVGLLCNAFRLMNNVDPLVPLAVVALLAAGAGWGAYAMLA
jgi:hypothetical protein